ncbi:hypothetical protein LCGC14_1600190 [marine sediment metagenome]|uniref:Uncharacterized protein n=1 Tax=marine sediment metagenome TaxID=412755 RepID=A0A0F9LBG5_9ZZZZ
METQTDQEICVHCHHWIEEHNKSGCDAPAGHQECTCPGFKGGGPCRDC